MPIEQPDPFVDYCNHAAEVALATIEQKAAAKGWQPLSPYVRARAALLVRCSAGLKYFGHPCGGAPVDVLMATLRAELAVDGKAILLRVSDGRGGQHIESISLARTVDPSQLSGADILDILDVG